MSIIQRGTEIQTIVVLREQNCGWQCLDWLVVEWF